MARRGLRGLDSSDISDRLPGIREVTIKQTYPDDFGVVIGMVYQKPGTTAVRTTLYGQDFPDDYYATMLIRFRQPVEVRGLAQDAARYLKRELPKYMEKKRSLKKMKLRQSANPAIYEMVPRSLEGNGLDFYVSPRDNRSKKHRTVEISLNHFHAVAILSAYARDVLGTEVRKVITRH